MKKNIFYFIIIVVLVLSIENSQAQQRSLSLEETVTLALKNNPELKASEKEIEKSRQQKIIARSLFLPNITLAASMNHYFQLQPFFGFGGATPENKISYGRFGGADQLTSAVQAIQPVYNPQAFPSLQRSRLQEEASSIELRGRQVQTSSLVKQIYLKLLVLQERLKLQRESIHRNEQVLADSRALLNQGKGLRVDTLRAYTSLKNLEPELLRLTFALETNKLQLKALLGMDALQDIALTDSLNLIDPETIPAEDEVYNTARQNNSEFQLLALQEKIEDQYIRQSVAARLPVINAIGQYQVQTQTNQFDYGNALYPSSSFVGLQLAVPLYTGSANQAKGRQATLGKEQALLRIKNAQEQLRATVHQVVAQGHESIRRLQTTATVQETAKLSYTIIQYRYTKGAASRLELSDAEFTLATSQSNYLEAVYDYLNARIAMLELMGRVK